MLWTWPAKEKCWCCGPGQQRRGGAEDLASKGERGRAPCCGQGLENNEAHWYMSQHTYILSSSPAQSLSTLELLHPGERGAWAADHWCRNNLKSQFLKVHDNHTCQASIPTIIMIDAFFNDVLEDPPIQHRADKNSIEKYKTMLRDYSHSCSILSKQYNSPPEQLSESKNSDGRDHPTRTLRIGGEDMEADDCIPILLFGENPQVPWIKEQDVAELQKMIESVGNCLFIRLVGGRVGGGKSKRSFTQNLADFNILHNLVEKCMSPYISWVQQKLQPSLQHYKLAILRSDVGAGSQYEGCGGKLHSDFDDSVNKRPPQKRPISLLVALDEFEFMYLHNRKVEHLDLSGNDMTKHGAKHIASYIFCKKGAT